VNYAFQIDVNEGVHAFYWHHQVLVLALFVEVCTLSGAGVCENEVEALVLLEDGCEGSLLTLQVWNMMLVEA
jgi:hypothetical protein